MINTQKDIIEIELPSSSLEASTKKRGPYKIFKEEVYALEQQGWATWQIARKMGIARRSVLRVLRERHQPDGDVC
jgi:DNA-binding transcriptional regulator LsrR (DeoR family)